MGKQIGDTERGRMAILLLRSGLRLQSHQR
jgi:hypothetical protein